MLRSWEATTVVWRVINTLGSGESQPEHTARAVTEPVPASANRTRFLHQLIGRGDHRPRASRHSRNGSEASHAGHSAAL